MSTALAAQGFYCPHSHPGTPNVPYTTKEEGNQIRVLSDATTTLNPAPLLPGRGPAARPSGPQGRPHLPAPRVNSPRAAPHGRQGRAGPLRTAPSWGDSGRDNAAEGTAGPARYVAAGATEPARPGREAGTGRAPPAPVAKERGSDTAGETGGGARERGTGPPCPSEEAAATGGAQADGRHGPKRPAGQATAHPVRGPAPARQLPAPRAAAVLVQVSEARRRQR